MKSRYSAPFFTANLTRAPQGKHCAYLTIFMKEIYLYCPFFLHRHGNIPILETISLIFIVWEFITHFLRITFCLSQGNVTIELNKSKPGKKYY